MFKKKETMAKLVKATQEKEELENQLKNAREKMQALEKELASAKEQIGEMEAVLKDTDLEAMKKTAKQSAAEYEGLKELYAGKIREFDTSRATREEEFARESAVKRHNLEEEIRTGREENQEQVSNTVKVFAGSYLYYMDQIRTMMDALSQAAAETGKTLFSGEAGDIKERFGASVAEHLRNDVGALEQGTGDRLLISAEDEIPEKAEEEEDILPEEEEKEETEEAEEAEETEEEPPAEKDSDFDEEDPDFDDD